MFNVEESEILHQGPRNQKAPMALVGIFFGAHHCGWTLLRLLDELAKRLPKARRLALVRIGQPLAAAKLLPRINVIDAGSRQSVLERLPVKLRRETRRRKTSHIHDLCDVVHKEQPHKGFDRMVRVTDGKK